MQRCDQSVLVGDAFVHDTVRDLIDPIAAQQNVDGQSDIEMLVAHPASAGHGTNLPSGSDTIVWFSLPWSAELFTQANARLARQGQHSHTVT